MQPALGLREDAVDGLEVRRGQDHWRAHARAVGVELRHLGDVDEGDELLEELAALVGHEQQGAGLVGARRQLARLPLECGLAEGRHAREARDLPRAGGGVGGEAARHEDLDDPMQLLRGREAAEPRRRRRLELDAREPQEEGRVERRRRQAPAGGRVELLPVRARRRRLDHGEETRPRAECLGRRGGGVGEHGAEGLAHQVRPAQPRRVHERAGVPRRELRE